MATNNEPNLDLLDRALAQTGRLIAAIQPDQARLPTPCPEWDVRALVNHTVYDVRLFTNLLAGGAREAPGADLIGEDWSAAYTAAADSLRQRWAATDLSQTLKLPFGEFPITWAIGQHLTDIAVHGWDIARATGQSTELDPAVARAGLGWARANLKPEYRGPAFGPEVDVPESAPIYDRLAAYAGRDPARTAAAADPGRDRG